MKKKITTSPEYLWISDDSEEIYNLTIVLEKVVLVY